MSDLTNDKNYIEELRERLAALQSRNDWLQKEREALKESLETSFKGYHQLEQQLAEAQKHYRQAYDLLLDIDALANDGRLPDSIASRLSSFLATHQEAQE